ncbi:MAG: hypothetical protein O3A51_02065 [Verrucomicrobia bacterium]|nr:hypothetical protein [Verrucomicrobiota bacterium]
MQKPKHITNDSCRQRYDRLALWVCGVVAVVCACLVGVTGWFGGRWTFGILTMRNPMPRLAVGALAALLWFWLWNRRQAGAMPWKRMCFKLVLLVIACMASWSFGERLLRVSLQRTQGFGTIDMLRDFEGGAPIAAQSRHPVAYIVGLSSNSRLIYELRPDLDQMYGDYYLATNADGLRESVDYARPKPPATQRILGIGDSGMFGWDVHQHENYLALLESSLTNRLGGAIEVLNSGVPGYNTQQQVEWLVSRGLDYEPDVVVVGWCNNDYDAPFFLYTPVDFMAMEGSLMYRFLFRRDQYFTDTKPTVSLYTSFEDADIHADVLAGMGKAGVRRALTRLTQLAAGQDFRVLVFGPMDADAVDICEGLDINYFNTLERIPKGSVPGSFNVHDMHPKAEGHAVLATHLESELERLGWVVPQS